VCATRTQKPWWTRTSPAEHGVKRDLLAASLSHLETLRACTISFQTTDWNTSNASIPNAIKCSQPTNIAKEILGAWFGIALSQSAGKKSAGALGLSGLSWQRTHRKALSGALRSKRVPHALLSRPPRRGVGKFTLRPHCSRKPPICGTPSRTIAARGCGHVPAHFPTRRSSNRFSNLHVFAGPFPSFFLPFPGKTRAKVPMLPPSSAFPLILQSDTGRLGPT